MTIDRIDTHADDAKARLPGYLAQATGLRKIVEILAERRQGVENTLFDLLDKRMLDAAEGAQLDILGVHVGEPRLGRSDADYAGAIGVRILVNTSSGNEQRLLDIARLYAAADAVEIFDAFPAAVIVEISGGTGDLVRMEALLQEARAAGVALHAVSHDTDNPFSVATLLASGVGTTDTTLDAIDDAGATFQSDGVVAGDVLHLIGAGVPNPPSDRFVVTLASETRIEFTPDVIFAEAGVEYQVQRPVLDDGGFSALRTAADDGAVAGDGITFTSATAAFQTNGVASGDSVYVEGSGLFVVDALDGGTPETKLTLTAAVPNAPISSLTFHIVDPSFAGLLAALI